MRVDPVMGSTTNPQSLNRYAYGTNDPINLADPFGLNANGYHDLVLARSIATTTTLLVRREPKPCKGVGLRA